MLHATAIFEIMIKFIQNIYKKYIIALGPAKCIPRNKFPTGNSGIDMAAQAYRTSQRR
jgi:hypothetical protein